MSSALERWKAKKAAATRTATQDENASRRRTPRRASALKAQRRLSAQLTPLKRVLGTSALNQSETGDAADSPEPKAARKEDDAAAVAAVVAAAEPIVDATSKAEEKQEEQEVSDGDDVTSEAAVASMEADPTPLGVRKRARWRTPPPLAVPVVPATPIGSPAPKCRCAALEAQVESLRRALAEAHAIIEAQQASMKVAPVKMAPPQPKMAVASPAKTTNNSTASQRAQLAALEVRRAGMPNIPTSARVQVVCRVRPMMPKDGQPSNTHRVRTVDHALAVESIRESHIGGNAVLERAEFNFDRVFGTDASQRDVYTAVRPIIRAAFDGGNVCVFAYGQTGSGKTHTMLGDGDGVMPRAIDDLFEWSEAAARRGVASKFRASVLELYCDSVHDLLDSSSATLPMRQAADGRVEVPGLTWRRVTSRRELRALLHCAMSARSEAATQMNARSSRSHAVLQLKVALADGRRGALALVDLAGSERISRSGVTDSTLRETQAINMSLATLGDVVGALGVGKPHVPFRNSKLTRLLEPYLSEGSAQTMLMVNVSPTAADATETMSSLRFAEKIKQVKK